MDPDLERMVELLNEIDDILCCPRCDLALSRTKVVVGSGPLDARIVLIGEAPGRNEDEKGEPFVGAAGRNLDALLEKSGIQRRDVYITNVVKCRPPGNRPPRACEIEACHPYLQRQLEAISPKIIVLMGRTAAEAMLERKVNLGKEHGTVIEKGGIKYMITYHPAAMIYNQWLGDTIAGDFKKVSALLLEG
ncbi:uracil-DNA glycosylase, family 4 [Methanocella conradii HZ254]|uniref:Type-4 uracil-DNA glycosylase n=1 Tax=Methanocella conradii (strain DSM 24694 / JCM 17849 / CGMCC 1.5162 / HZ254) TaxID=1041930 RepID=H8I7F5_METCZ|nr:uracil-DNA glycosylase [Methanocella conradii]AFD00821.1 uracil-DNA glycosylase, family 4 [Methanocella conradii HZ254]